MRIVPPIRESHTYTQRLNRPPETVFPLLCPVREAEWVNGWDPGLVISTTGVAEPDCVFTTGHQGAEAIWAVTEYLPPHRIGFVKLTPHDSVVAIRIVLEANDDGGTHAHVTYTMTALGAGGAEAVRTFTADHYATFMRQWEAELNHFMATGRKLEADASQRSP